VSVDWLGRAAARLADVGIGLRGVAAVDGESDVLPGARSAVVFASGGRGLWEAFHAAAARDPGRFAAVPDPLDTFIAEAVAAADPAPGPGRRWVLSAIGATPFVDFRPLGRAAGLGWPSRLGLLLHPVVGPWIALRAAVFTTDALPPTGALAGDGPCAGCPAPCVTACPVGAVRLDGAVQWDACRRHLGPPTLGCPSGCGARRACVVGPAFAYSVEQHAYHDGRPGARLRPGGPGAAGGAGG
jgi:hypothetical protein